MGVAAGRRPARPSSGSAAAAARAARTAGPSLRPESAPRLAAPTHGAAPRGRRRPAAGTGGRSPAQAAAAAPRHLLRVPSPGLARSGRLCIARVSTALGGRRAGSRIPGTRRPQADPLSGSLWVSGPQFPRVFQVSGVRGAVTEVGNSRARDKCRTRPCLCVWLDAWPRRRLVVNLGSHPKGTQGQADARGRGARAAEERDKPLGLGAAGPAPPPRRFSFEKSLDPAANRGPAQGAEVGAET